MGDKSKIEWTDATWNPVTGCIKVSAGCKHCYAERVTERFWPERKFFEVRLHPDRLDIPLRWRKPRRIFVCSRSDVFHEAVPIDFLDKIFDLIQQCPQHTFQVLTKRPGRMIGAMFGGKVRHYSQRFHLRNLWLGVSAENQQTADERIPLLLQTPAAVRWVSLEPLLGHINLDTWLWYAKPTTLRTPRVDWVVVGGESGPHARPMHPDWARSIRDQCQAAGVPFFFRGWGEWGEEPNMPDAHARIFQDGTRMGRAGKIANGRFLDGREWSEFPRMTR